MRLRKRGLVSQSPHIQTLTHTFTNHKLKHTSAVYGNSMIDYSLLRSTLFTQTVYYGERESERERERERETAGALGIGLSGNQEKKLSEEFGCKIIINKKI